MASKMSQPGTDYGVRGETGEKMPKGASSVDTKQERKSGAKERATPGVSGERWPPNVAKRDESGEKHGSMVGGVAQGHADGIPGRDGSHLGKVDGRTGELKGGRHDEGYFYKHGKDDYNMPPG